MKCLVTENGSLFIPIERGGAIMINTKDDLYLPIMVGSSDAFIALDEICTKAEIDNAYSSVREIDFRKIVNSHYENNS